MLNINLVSYWGLMIIASIVSTWGTFVSLPYEHLGQWDAIKMALPFAWVDWIFLTIAINIGNQHNLATPLQMKFGITMLKFFLIMVFTKYYLHAEVSRSDVVGFIIVFLAYLLNEFHGLSTLLGRNVDESKDAGKDKNKSEDDDKTKELTTTNKLIVDKVKETV
jgi:hypothetical protein